MRITQSENGDINTVKIQQENKKTNTNQIRKNEVVCVHACVNDENNNKNLYINREQVNARMLSFFYPLILPKCSYLFFFFLSLLPNEWACGFLTGFFSLARSPAQSFTLCIELVRGLKWNLVQNELKFNEAGTHNAAAHLYNDGIIYTQCMYRIICCVCLCLCMDFVV